MVNDMNPDVGSEECGGVGDVCGNSFIWMPVEENQIEAMFIDGQGLRFPNDKEGWTEFVGWSYFVGGAFFPVNMKDDKSD